MLKDNGDKVSGSEKSDVEAALSEARTVLQGSSSAADMNAAREKVTKASHKLAEAMYKARRRWGKEGRRRDRRRIRGRCRQEVRTQETQLDLPCFCLNHTWHGALNR
jgi:hypothetical protein